MKLETGDLANIVKKVGHTLLEQKLVVTAVLMLGIGAYTLMRINTLTDPQVDQDYLEEQESLYEVVEFDQEAIERISNLEDTDINVTSDIDSGRNNPFAD